MIFGFNTDVHGQDGVCHVQTEDRGEKNPVIESIVYIGGKILGKKRTPYDPAALSREQIEEAVRHQHKEMTEAIRNGTWRPAAAVAHAGAGHAAAHTAGQQTGNGSYRLELTNSTVFPQGEYLRFPIAVRHASDQRPASEVSLEVLWLVDGAINDRQRLSSRADGGADIWVSAPGAAQPSALLVRAQGSQGTSFAKFAVTPAN